MQQQEKSVFRNFAIPVSAFDYLKEFQRGYEQRHKVRLTNNQILTIILKEHQAHQINVEEEASCHEHGQS